MVGLEGTSDGMPVTDGYPNETGRQAWMIMATVAGTDLVISMFLLLLIGIKGLPFVLFIVGSTAVFCYTNYRSQIKNAPVRVALERNGLRFAYHDGREEAMGWDRIADIVVNPGDRSGSAVLLLVDRFLPVRVPAEVANKAGPMLDQDERNALERSALKAANPRTKASKKKARDRCVGRTLMALLGVSIPAVLLLLLYTVLWL